MHTWARRLILAGAPVLIAAAGSAAAQAPSSSAGKKEPVAAQISGPTEAKWTDTTTAAATTPDQKAVLKSGKPTTVTGEVVDISCYLQLGKRGEKHVPCGTKCLQNGQPIGVLDDQGVVYMLFAEEHDPRRDGQLDLKATFIPLLAKRVTVTGVMTQHKGMKGIFVHAASLKGAAPPGSPAKPPAP